MVLIPVYEDPDDAKSSPFALSNVEPFTWQWLSTINRVNSQVQKVRPSRFFFLRLVGLALI
jgi:tRNA-splicing endonuclease subunit Sen2